MIELIEKDDGGLTVKVIDRDDFLEEVQRAKKMYQADESLLVDLLEAAHYLGNDWHVFNASDMGWLSESPCIGWGAIYGSDDDYPSDFEAIWWFPNYQVRSCIDDLLERGQAVFAAVPKE